MTRPTSELIAELRAKVAKYEERLEIDHAFRVENGEMVRFEIPEDERATFPDAVTCREATIELIEENNKTLRTRLSSILKAWEAFRPFVGRDWASSGPEWVAAHDDLRLAITGTSTEVRG